MAFPTSVRLSFRQVLETGTTKKCPLGTRGTTPDGRVFRYAKNGATALVAGILVSPADYGEPACINTSACCQLPANTTVYPGAQTITIGGSYYDAGLTANTYQDGYILVGSTWDVGSPMMLRVKRHTAQAGNTSEASTGLAVFTLDDGADFSTCINTSMGFGLLKNAYDGVLAQPSTGTAKKPLIGVPITAVSANYYFWLQTWGECMMRFAETCTSGLTLGRKVIPSFTDNTTGVYCIGSSNYHLVDDTGEVAEAPFYDVGYIVSPAAAGGYGLVNLRLAP